MKALIKFSWIGPLIFVSSILIFGFLNPGYSHINQFISELGANKAPNNQLMNFLGIIPFGLSIVLFSIGSLLVVKKNVLGKIAFVILTLTGILFVIAGIFICDEGCNFDNMTQESIIHNLSAFSAFILFIISAIILGMNSFTKKRNNYYVYSLIVGILGMFLFYLISEAGIYSEFRGLYQRLFLINFLIWLVVIGVYINKLTTTLYNRNAV